MAAIHRFNGTDRRFDWEDVKAITYEDGPAKNVTGKILISRADDARHFAFRYFRIEPGGHTTLNDYHAHDHGVLILHGRAQVTVENGVFELGPMDIVFIKPWEHHSLRPIGDEPMGFLCVIPNKDMLKKLETVAEKND